MFLKSQSALDPPDIKQKYPIAANQPLSGLLLGYMPIVIENTSFSGSFLHLSAQLPMSSARMAHNSND